MIKFITQPNIITKELETVEKPDIFDIGYYRTSKNCYQIIKAVKQLIIINQQPNKIRVYSESKTADRTLQLDLN